MRIYDDNSNMQKKDSISNAVQDETKSVISQVGYAMKMSAKNSANNILGEVINLLADGVKSVISIAIFGEPYKNNRGGYWNNNISYRNYYDYGSSYNYKPNYQDRPSYNYATLPVSNVSTGTFRSYTVANEALSKMDDIIEQYGILRISDMIEISKQCDETFIFNDTYVNNSFGWDDITSAQVKPADNGRWRIEMPKEKPLNR